MAEGEPLVVIESAVGAKSQLLSLSGVQVSYGCNNAPVLVDVDLTLSGGQVTGITGVSGSGKTTLLRVCAGVVSPTSGVVDRPRSRFDIAYSPQDDVLLEYRTVWENAALLVERRAVTEDWGRMVVAERLSLLLDRVNLLTSENASPRNLSGGMRQRLQVIQALATRAPVILLDEPFAQQDRGYQYILEELIWFTAKRFHSSIIVVSHDVDSLGALCDRVIYVGGIPGRIATHLETPAELASVAGETRRRRPGYAPFSERLWTERAKVAAL